MSEQRHTQGPYRAQTFAVYSPDGELLAQTGILGNRLSGAQNEANARLFAAAPELLEALRRMDRMHELMMSMTNHGSSWYDANTLREMNEAPIQAARALAKATGESTQAARERSVR